MTIEEIRTMQEIVEMCDLTSKALKQEKYKDCISREAAIRVAEQGQIQGYGWQFKQLVTMPPVIPQALEQKECEDTISRQAVLKQLKGCLLGGEEEYQYVKLHIDSIPSVKPQENVIEAIRNIRAEGKKDGAIEALRNLKEEIQDRADNTPYTNQLSVDAHKLDIDIINKQIKNWKAE